MSFISYQGTEFFLFSNLKALQGINHVVTTRKGGNSSGDAAGFNLSYSVEDNPQGVALNRKIVASYLNINPENLIFPKQTHSDNIVIVTPHTTYEELQGVDALITQMHGIAIGVMSADCVPVLIADPIKRVVAAVHAGWKGTVAGIVKKTVLKMLDEFNCNPQNLFVGIGPSISALNYEVGPDVIEAVQASFPQYKKLLIAGKTEGKAYFDLWKANQIWLTSCGIPESQIETAGICTFGHPNTFYSARYFHHKTGRFGACISIS
ncbi:MAG: peptidoglycan editing factor PgeF [Flavobacteriales bacterium]|nr:peptidoglycan editing factor PgeF [Flavobacteriales bacterium]